MFAPSSCSLAEPALAAHPAALLLRHAPSVAGAEARLRGVIADAVHHPGGLFRLRLVLAIGRAQTVDPEAAGQLAAAVEFFHTASLLFDDLPCMDDAAERRGRPCAHIEHGDAAALLGALAFINRGYALVAEATAVLPFHLRTQATRALDTHLGPAGLVGGQARDLAYAHGPRSPRAVGRAAQGKTVALLRLTLLLPALAGGSSEWELQLLHRLAVYWGQLYQGLDDLRDLRLAAATGSAKSDGRDLTLSRPNLALAAGLDATRPRLSRLERLAARTLQELLACGRRWSVLLLFHRQLAAPLDEVLALR